MAYKPSSKYVVGTSSMRASSKGVSNGSNSGNFFSVDEGGERESRYLFFGGPLSARQGNAI